MPATASPPDAQKDLLYAAQWDDVPEGTHYRTAKAMEAFLEGVFARSWFRQRFPKVIDYKVHLVPDAPVARGWGELAICHMELPPWARQQRTVLHELAHGLTQLHHRDGVEGHGPEF